MFKVQVMEPAGLEGVDASQVDSMLISKGIYRQHRKVNSKGEKCPSKHVRPVTKFGEAVFPKSKQFQQSKTGWVAVDPTEKSSI
jgi:hypothetical protein|uniref:Uncharacterized protein n=1 Tax=Picea glauca TaxID=3330 RepID=A0A101LXY0_PICGL|nr:hypothetical protein ABT39_MTgene5582 [Picea glauca]